MTEEFIKEAESKLAELDPLLGSLIARQRLMLPERRHDYFASLCRSIVGQQVSVAAARAIFTRLEMYTKLKPDAVASLPESAIKEIGLSKSKAKYIMDLSTHFMTNPSVYNHLEMQSDEQVVSELTEIKGVGVWTAQMFLIFTLTRPDVFAVADTGLLRAMAKLYGWATIPPKAKIEELSNTWQPYRTIASLHLWHSLDNSP